MTMHSDDARPTAERLLAETEWVRALARTLIVDPGTADDVAQDAAVLALTKPPAVAVRGWFRRVVRNLASNARRGDSRRTTRERANAEPEAGDAADETVARWEIRRRVVDAVLGLDEPYRSTILLRFFDGLTAADAAARLGVPLETVRTRTKRGVEILRGRLANLDDGRGRKGAAVLLLLAHREADIVGPVTASIVGKGLVMASASKTVGVAAVVLIAAAVTWSVVTTSRPAAPDNRAIAAQPGPPPKPRHAPASADAGTAAAAPTDGIDLSTCDRDRDLFGDVVSADGRPVAGAAVRVTRVKPLGQLIRTSAFLDIYTEAEATKSGFDGTFALRLAAREGVGLRVEAPGFARWESFYRQAGERVRVTLSPALTLTVTVKSHDGAPVAGANVSVSADGETAGGGTFGRPRAATSADGVARIAGLRRGTKVFLYVTPAAHPIATRHLTLADAAEQSLDIVLPQGRALRGVVVDRVTGTGLGGAVVTMSGSADAAATTDELGRFEIPDAQADHGVTLGATAAGHARGRVVVRSVDADVRIALGPAARITGRVLDADGRPFAGADVAAHGARGPADADGGERSTGGATTGEDGRFVVDGLVPETVHSVRVQATGRAKTVAWVQTSSVDPWTKDAGDIRLAAPRTVTAVVVDRDDRPVARVHVVLTSALQDDPFRDHRWSDDLGRLAFGGLPSGEYLLEVQPDDPAWTREGVAVRVPESSDPSPVTIHLGGDPEKLKTRIPVAVRVTDEDGNPLAGVQVYVGYAANGGAPAATSGADGRVAFSAEHEPATVSAYLTPEQSKTLLREWRYLRPGARDIAVVIRRGRTVAGRLLFEDDTPVPGGGVTAWRGATSVAWGTSDQQGNFAFAVPDGGDVDLQGTPQEEPRVVSRSTGELRGVRPGADGLVIRVTREPAARAIDVEVVDEAGAPVAKAWVQTDFRGKDWERPLTGTTDSDGRCRISGLPRAPVVASVTIRDERAGPNRYWSPQSVRLASNADSARIVVGKPRVVTGLIVAEDGSPVAGAVVHASPGGSLQGSMNIAGPDGRFEILVPPDATLPFPVHGNPFPPDFSKPLTGYDLVEGEERELRIVVRPVPKR